MSSLEDVDPCPLAPRAVKLSKHCCGAASEGAKFKRSGRRRREGECDSVEHSALCPGP